MADDKTFTQAEVDSIIEGRLAREHEKYADYDSLKDKAGKYDEIGNNWKLVHGSCKTCLMFPANYPKYFKMFRRCVAPSDAPSGR